MNILRFFLKHVAVAFALLAAANVFAEGPKEPKKPDPSAAVSSDPVVGKWKIEHPKGDVVWTFHANQSLERISKLGHEKGKWQKMNDLTPPAYQCVFKGGADIVKVTYSADPEHLSMLREDNRTRVTAKRISLK
jgi:hypothetical protein